MPGARTCFIHIGLPKTGTSYVQTIFERSSGELRDQGLQLWPESATPFQVMLDVRDALDDAPQAVGALDRLAADAAAFTGSRAILSQELLSQSTSEQIPRLLRALDGYEVHVIVTVRDLAAQFPSMWQQQIKGRGLTAYDAWVDRMVARTDFDLVPAVDLVAALRRWREHVPAERTHVVTMPKRGGPRGLLLERFCQVVDIDPSRLEAASGFANSSLGAPQAELLRRVNVALGDRLDSRTAYRGPGRLFLAEKILVQQEGRPARLPARARPWMEARTQEVVDELRAGGYDLVGDLADLAPDDSDFEETPTEVAEADVARAATEALAAILAARSEEQARRRELRRRVAQRDARIAELEAALAGRRLPRVRALAGRVRRRSRRS